MDEHNNPDRLPFSGQSEHADAEHDRPGSPSLGTTAAAAAASANSRGDAVSPTDGDEAADATSMPSPAQVDPNAKIVNEVLSSEIGVQTLLNRLKQSIASAKEFALFLKKRSALEDEHATGLKKLCRTTAESIRRPENRHGSFLKAYEELTMIHERMADNESQYASSLHQMHDDLLELAAQLEKNRKHWKTTGLSAEQHVSDLEAAMRKSKAKYDSLAEDYDRARTGDKQTGKKFGLKGPKSAAQYEEDLLRKVQAADSDYAQKVQTAQRERAELWTKLRPEAVKALQDLINECDAALGLQMVKFASFNEKLLLSNGLNISPLQGIEGINQVRSLREVVYSIDNKKDLSNFISSYGSRVPPRAPDINYERNPVLNPVPQPMSAPPLRQSDSAGLSAAHQGPPPGFTSGLNQSPPPPNMAPQFPNQGHSAQAAQPHERSFSQGPGFNQDAPHQRNNSHMGSVGSAAAMGGSMSASQRGPPPPSHGQYNPGSISASGPPQLSTLSFQNSPASQSLIPQNKPTQPMYAQSPATPQSQSSQLPPLRPVFGVSLDHLFERDGSAVPMVVNQCIQAVDLFGLEVEGIYRLSGTTSHVNKLKVAFNNDATQVDFRNPESFYHDVNSVAGLLKQFFRELPSPLLTAEHYGGFIEAAKSEDDIVRRDSLHAIINALPDPNYATLRALTLHLNRITEASSTNRMNASNLAIVFGPTLMGASTGPNIQDAGWQVRVIDTILNNTYQIFDDD